MVFNYSKLKGRIVEIYGSQGNFAEKYGISKQMMTYKMRGQRGITTKDIIKMSEMLRIPKEQIGEYFFTLAV